VLDGRGIPRAKKLFCPHLFAIDTAEGVAYPDLPAFGHWPVWNDPSHLQMPVEKEKDVRGARFK